MIFFLVALNTTIGIPLIQFAVILIFFAKSLYIMIVNFIFLNFKRNKIHLSFGMYL